MSFHSTMSQHPSFETPGCGPSDPFNRKTILLEIALAAVPVVITIVAQKLVEEVADHFKRERHAKKSKGDKPKGGDLVELDGEDGEPELLHGPDGELYVIIDGIVYPAQEVTVGKDKEEEAEEEAPVAKTKKPTSKKPHHLKKPAHHVHKPVAKSMFRGMNEIG